MVSRKDIIYIDSHVILGHLGADTVTGALHILDSMLDLVGGGDVLPGVQEGFLLHGSCTY